MEVTVKTLDSQTKTFQVPSEITVKEFKEKISEEMGIPVEKQRLIFQGKVLQDNKPLQEYRVDGCVVHLVEKQPPRTGRPDGQSTESTTSSTATTSSPGNMFMGAFAMPVDVMGVTQQIVQGIIQQIGAESAQANISTSSSDDGSSVNVHINLSTIMARNDARSRIAPARVHLNNVSSIISRLRNDGLPSSDLGGESMSSERSTGGEQENNNNNENSLEDLADVLQEVVRINEEIRPHLERYQQLLRSPSERELRPVDDALPDLTAEALHSLSHAYHALSDLTTNLRISEPRIHVLPPLSPVSRSTPSTSQSQTSTSSSNGTAQVTPAATTIAAGIPIGFGLRTGSGVGSGIRFGVGQGLGSRSGPRPARATGVNLGSRFGIPAGVGVLPGNVGLHTGLNETPPGSVEPTAGASSSTGNNAARPDAAQQQPFTALPINLRNLPNFAVQFNPASGNITIAHIVTTAVEEPNLRSTTTTTNSTPTPRTSSRGSSPVPPAQTNPTVSTSVDSNEDSSQPAASSSSTTTTSDRNLGDGAEQSGGRPRGTNAVVNFLPQHAGHRDPLLPCQSFHFGSLAERPGRRSVGSQASGARQGSEVEGEVPAGQQGERPLFNPTQGLMSNPTMVDLGRIMNFGSQLAAGASTGSSNSSENNPFLNLLIQEPETSNSRDGGDFMLRMASVLGNISQSTNTGERERPEEQNVGDGILSRFMHRLMAAFPLHQLLAAAVGAADPYILTRSMTQDFLKNDILNGDEPTPQNLQLATERILEELQGKLETAFAQCNVKDNIDAPATLLTYLRPKIRRLLEIINSSESDAVYTTEMSALLSRTLVELIALTEYCLQDGAAGMENALRTSLLRSSVASSLDPGTGRMAVDMLLSCVRELQGSAHVRESALLPFVVRKEKRQAEKGKASSSSPPSHSEGKSSSYKSREPHASQDVSNTSSSSRRSRTCVQTEEVAMETDENWKKVIPPEWVPVISQDIIRQQRMPRQAPFSDAYLNGMPPKRRKLHERSEPAPYNHCVSATLKRSITKAGVTPHTDIEKVDDEATNSALLERVFEEEMKSEVRKRLASDSDYNAEKFPSIHKYFEKDEKR